MVMACKSNRHKEAEYLVPSLPPASLASSDEEACSSELDDLSIAA